MKVSFEIKSPFWQMETEWDYPVLPRAGEYIDLAFIVPEDMAKKPDFYSAKVSRVDWMKINDIYPVIVLEKI
ncbi:hypothetical protein [Mucilaginibacter straminoryzae]|nr:hypothetical protein [Mucilaginibacter straminoryzae]